MSLASLGMSISEMRRRQEVAKAKGGRFRVDPEVREARARVAAEREAVFEQSNAKAKAEQEAAPTAFQAILKRGTIDELSEVARSIGRMDPRRIEEIVGEIFRAKSRSQAYQSDDATPAPSATDLSEIAVGAGGAARASSGRRNH